MVSMDFNVISVGMCSDVFLHGLFFFFFGPEECSFRSQSELRKLKRSLSKRGDFIDRDLN